MLFQNTNYIISGKYVPAISYKIHSMNSKGSFMPLKGLAIGDGLCDPPNQLDYADFLYQVGLLDEADRDLVSERTDMAKMAMESQQWHKATDVTFLSL